MSNRTQENLIKGSLSAHAVNGRRQSTHAVQEIRLNRALWLSAVAMSRLKAEGLLPLVGPFGAEP